MEGEYERLERNARRPLRIRDHSARWERLTPLADASGTLRDRVEAFAQSKGISVHALEALGTRLSVGRSGLVELAWAGRNHDGRVVEIKYRPVGASSHESRAEQPSVWLRPIVVGKGDSMLWLVAEGETDGARLYDLVGDVAATIVTPAGARAFKREWAHAIPRGATVALCHDADEEGDAGAAKAAALIGSPTLRVPRRSRTATGATGTATARRSSRSSRRRNGRGSSSNH